MQMHLLQKQQLTNPKRGDTFETLFYLDGWRMCSISYGSKWVDVKALASKAKKRLTTRNARDIFSSMYWKAAHTEEFYSNNCKKPRKGWEEKY